MPVKIFLRFLAAMTLSAAFYALVGALFMWYHGNDPRGWFIALYLAGHFHGFWLYLVGLMVLLGVAPALNRGRGAWRYGLTGAGLGLVLPLLIFPDYLDSGPGIPFDFVAYLVSGAAFGVLAYYWIIKPGYRALGPPP